MGRHWPSFMYLLSGMIHSVSNHIRVLGILRLLIGYILLRSIWTWCVLSLWTYVIKNYMVGDQIKRLGRISVLFLQNTAGEASASFFFAGPGERLHPPSIAKMMRVLGGSPVVGFHGILPSSPYWSSAVWSGHSEKRGWFFIFILLNSQWMKLYICPPIYYMHKTVNNWERLCCSSPSKELFVPTFVPQCNMPPREKCGLFSWSGQRGTY